MGVDPELWILVHGGFDGAATWPMPFRWGTYIAYMKFLRDDLQKAVDRNLLLRHVPRHIEGQAGLSNTRPGSDNVHLTAVESCGKSVQRLKTC